MIVIDATNLILGRLATFAAKQALLGEEVRVINADKAIISGTRARVLQDLKQRKARGTPAKGPFIPTMADRFVRRSIRGMLPYKQPKGVEAYKRILCYVGMPEALAKETPIALENASAKKLPTLKYVTVADALKHS